MSFETEVTEELMRTRKKSPTIILVIIVAVVVLLAAGGFVGHHLYVDHSYNKVIELGDKYMEEGNYQEAIEAYNKCVSIKKREPSGLEKLAEAYEKNNQPSEAVEVYDTLFSITGEEKYEKERNEAQERQKKNQTSEELFRELSDTTFMFASGVGGWSTQMKIKTDGSFVGEYYDEDLANPDDDYMTKHLCDFSGRFKDVEKVGKNKYTMTLDGNMKLKKKPGTKEVVNGEHYEYTPPYGMEGLKDGEKVTVLAPGYPLKKLDDLNLGWYSFDEHGSELEDYAIRNKDSVFFTYEG